MNEQELEESWKEHESAREQEYIDRVEKPQERRFSEWRQEQGGI